MTEIWNLLESLLKDHTNELLLVDCVLLLFDQMITNSRLRLNYYSYTFIIIIIIFI